MMRAEGQQQNLYIRNRMNRNAIGATLKRGRLVWSSSSFFRFFIQILFVVLRQSILYTAQAKLLNRAARTKI